MKPFSFGGRQRSSQYHELIEGLELLRSRLRLSRGLDQQGVEKVLDELGGLRSRALLLSRSQQLGETAAELPPDENAEIEVPVAEPVRSKARRSSYDDLGFEGVLGESPGLLTALEIVSRAAPTDLPFLIEGESGTGKELFAKVIHANGLRTEQPFVSINCGAIPENLIESELFGHKKGAFTGAVSDRKGHFESAHTGTIFLDEVGELPLAGQVKLLRVLQSSELQRVGSDEVINVDVRIIAATNRDLMQMSRDGTFREDLFYRLSVIQAKLPPLRERRDEIPLLFDYFSNEVAENLQREPVTLSEPLSEFLHGYAYPGNIREMRNLIYRVSCLADEVAELKHLPDNLLQASPETGDVPPVAFDSGASLGEIKKQAGDLAERTFLENGLRSTQGSVVNLAKQLKLNRSYLQTLLKKHGIRSKSFKP